MLIPVTNRLTRQCTTRRDLQPGESALQPDEQALLDRICKAYYLPAWCSISDYRGLFEAEGLKVCPTAQLHVHRCVSWHRHCMWPLAQVSRPYR